MRLELSTAIGCIKVITAMQEHDAARELNVLEDDFRFIRRPNPWINSDKHRAVRILNNLCSSTITKLGLPPLMLSAEYISCILYLYTSPSNWMTGACWLGRHYPNSDLANFKGEPDNIEGCEFVTPREIFAMCCCLAGDETSQKLSKNFESKFRKEIKRHESQKGQEI